MSGTVERPRGPAGLFTAVDLVDVFVYVVVLNLAAEYLPAIIAETFTLSLLTAVLLKVVLEVVVALKDRVKARFKAATTAGGRILAWRCGSCSSGASSPCSSWSRSCSVTA